MKEFRKSKQAQRSSGTCESDSVWIARTALCLFQSAVSAKLTAQIIPSPAVRWKQFSRTRECIDEVPASTILQRNRRRRSGVWLGHACLMRFSLGWQDAGSRRIGLTLVVSSTFSR